jgi:phosphoribosylanthranilate isomerase
MWVKICANTNLEDTLQVTDLGADAVGFVFAPSKRQITSSQVAAITAHLRPDVERVGVFPAGDAAGILSAVREAGLTAVQMHGGVNLGHAAKLRDSLGDSVSLIHVAHWEVAGGAEAEREIRTQLDAFAGTGLDERILLDARMGSASGGLGVSFDWQQARSVLADYSGLRIIVAGGLRPENVAEAIQTLTPYGVDVASGVEAEPGRKDPERLRLFIENARRA